jgi:hypothetical protein
MALKSDSAKCLALAQDKSGRGLVGVGAAAVSAREGIGADLVGLELDDAE